MSNENLGRISWDLRMTPIVFEILSKTPFKCSLKFSLLSEIKPRCYWDSVWLTWELLKVRLGWTGFLSIVCSPPLPFCRGRGRVEPPTKFSKRLGLDRTSTFRGGLLGKRGATFFRGGGRVLQLSHKKIN